MKVSVYTIAKNEEQFVERWFNSAKDADQLVILDTGSIDNTVDIAESLGINVVRFEVIPWRFDVARNAALSLVAEDVDYCIALDMDEILIDGWRDQLEKALEQGITRPRYKYIWSWKSEDVPGLQYGGDKIHSRHGYRWKHPVHETLVPEIPEVQGWFDFEIHHHPDSTKSRSQYLPLLELAVEEDPEDDRNTHYLAREYFFKGRLEESEKLFIRHLLLEKAVWGAERSESCRYLYRITKNVYWLQRAIEEAPGRREPRVDLAKHYYSKNEWWPCLQASLDALEFKDRPLEYLTDEDSWGYAAHDFAAISAYNLRLYSEAIYHGEKALQIEPENERLGSNLNFYLEAR